MANNDTTARAERASAAPLLGLGAVALVAWVVWAGAASGCLFEATPGDFESDAPVDAGSDATVSPAPPPCYPITLPGGWTLYGARTEPTPITLLTSQVVLHDDGELTTVGTLRGTLAEDPSDPWGVSWTPSDMPVGDLVQRLAADGSVRWVAWASPRGGASPVGVGDDGGVILNMADIRPGDKLHVTGQEPLALGSIAALGTNVFESDQHTNAALLRLDRDGALLWMRTFGFLPDTRVDNYYPFSLGAYAGYPDGGVLVLASMTPGILESGEEEALLADGTNPGEGGGYAFLRLQSDGTTQHIWTVSGVTPVQRPYVAADGSMTFLLRVSGSVGTGWAPLWDGLPLEFPEPPDANPSLWLLPVDGAGTPGVPVKLLATHDASGTVRDAAWGPTGELFLRGAFEKSTTFGTGPEAVTLVRQGAWAVQPYVAAYSAAGALRWAKPLAILEDGAGIGGHVRPSPVGGLTYASGVGVGALAFPGEGPDPTMELPAASPSPAQGVKGDDYLVALGEDGTVQAAARVFGAQTNSGWGPILRVRGDGHVLAWMFRTGPTAFVTPQGSLDLLPDVPTDMSDPLTPRTLVLELAYTGDEPTTEGCARWHPAP